MGVDVLCDTHTHTHIYIYIYSKCMGTEDKHLFNSTRTRSQVTLESSGWHNFAVILLPPLQVSRHSGWSKSQGHLHTHTHTHIYIYIYIYIKHEHRDLDILMIYPLFYINLPQLWYAGYISATVVRVCVCVCLCVCLPIRLPSTTYKAIYNKCYKLDSKTGSSITRHKNTMFAHWESSYVFPPFHHTHHYI